MDARTLSLPISRLKYHPPCHVVLGAPVSEVIDLMQKHQYGGVLVVDEQQKLVGIVTERDLLVHIMGKQVDPAQTAVDDIMTPSPESLRASDPVAFALNLMHLGHYRHVPLLIYDDNGNGYPVGMITSKDILNHVAAFIESGKER
jgi:CBS domain-containing protein